ncbi:MAG: response regulator, partial [Alphaproteobacteria bacterium]|nr:response regulator [Alphaproteobacteria bacterium]
MIEKAQPITILLIEDNDGDIFLTKKAFQNAKIVNRIDVAKDGEIALDMLRNNGPYKDSVRPDIILMDLNLPKKDGLQVLAEIKLDESLRR